MRVLVVHAGSTVVLAIAGRLVRFPEVTLLHADHVAGVGSRADRYGVVVLGPCLSSRHRARVDSQLDGHPVPVIDLAAGHRPRPGGASDHQSRCASAVSAALAAGADTRAAPVPTA